jgi:hypothetical protein
MSKPAAEKLVAKKATATKKKASGSKEKAGGPPSRLIDATIKELGDWRGETLARARALIKRADPEVVETWKWRGCRCGSTPVSSAQARPTRTS